MAQGGGLREKLSRLLEQPLDPEDRQRLQSLAIPFSPRDRDYIANLWEKHWLAINRKDASLNGDARPNLRNPRAAWSWRRTHEPDAWEAKARELSGRIALLEAQLSEAKTEIDRLRELGKRAVDQRVKAEERARDLQSKLGIGNIQAGQGTKFTEVKRSFAKMYHPNSSTSRGGIEAAVRAEIFKEFWSELERIERTG